MASKDVISLLLGSDVSQQISQLNEQDADRVATLMRRPDISVRLNRTRVPYGVTLISSYGQILLDDTFTNIENVYVNGTKFNVKENGLDAVEKLLSGVDTAKDVIGEQEGRRKSGRRVRMRKRDGVPFESLQERAFEDLSSVGINYDNLFDELNGLMSGRNVSVGDIADELFGNDVDSPDIARFLVYDSQYRTDIVSQVYGLPLTSDALNYNFEPVHADDSFVGRLMTSLGVEDGEYDRAEGVLRVNDRLITNLPDVDDRGVFHNGDKSYIPYHIGYFAETEGSRVERLRAIDPVQSALDSLKLQYDLTTGDIKFRTILDVTRNLPDFETHPYSEELLDTFVNRKIVLDKRYSDTNSLLAEYGNRTDDLGATALTMLDDDAIGLIDPYGTSNGSNMGTIFYLVDDAVINSDHTITRGQEVHNKIGRLVEAAQGDGDNFNRNQMSYNAFLTSKDIHTLNAAFTEFGLRNSEDAIVMSKKGAEKYGAKVGDKMTDFHGDKGVISVIVDPNMDPVEAEAKGLTHAVEFMKANPEIDIVVSPVSVASRLNTGILREGLSGEKHDLNLLDGSVVKDGVVQIQYMSLPQTSEHKSKDYGREGDGRKYSTLFRHVLSSKIGEELYKKAFISEEVRNEHIDEIGTAFQRLGITFNDEHELIRPGNVNTYSDAPVTVDASDFSMSTPAVIRLSLMNQMVDGQINVDLGDLYVTSPLTGEPIVDSTGANVLPIRVGPDMGIPYRYTDVFKAISLGNADELQRSFAHAASVDYRQLTRKNNLLKNIDTMTFKDGAATKVIIPDPTVKLGEVRSEADDEHLIIHRDPCIQSGNVISVTNVGGAEPNVLHVHPLMINQVQGDFDGDTMGENVFKNMNLTQDEKEAVMYLASVYEQLNHYGEVFLSTDSSHFVACAKASGIDISNLNFDDGKNNYQLAHAVEDVAAQIVNSPNSYGAYSLSFENENSVKESLGQLADDGIKGSREQLEYHFENGYSRDENRAVMKALIAKSEWTGLAGAITNNLIAGFGDGEFDADLVRSAMDVTSTMTQSVLQMKKNADKLPYIDKCIKDMKTVMNGKYDTEKSREVLKTITEGLIPGEAIDKFVDTVASKQRNDTKFGKGVINGMDMTTTKLSYVSGDTFGKAVINVSKQSQHHL